MNQLLSNGGNSNIVTIDFNKTSNVVPEIFLKNS